MTQYTWTIENLEYNNDQFKGVSVAHWKVIAEEDGYTDSAYGSVSFTPNPTNPNFVVFEELTEDVVLGWVWGFLAKGVVEANLARSLHDQRTPPTLTGLPWV